MSTVPSAQPATTRRQPPRPNRKRSLPAKSRAISRLPGSVIVFAGKRADAVAAVIRLLDRIA